MKKLLSLLVLFSMFASPVMAADQWAEGQPAGTAQASDIDALSIVNNEALDRLNRNYRRGLGINYSSASALSVLTGEVAIPNSDATTVRYRATTSSTSVGWADIDTGAEATSTQYYVYATADTDITGMVFKISTSSSAPSGITYYRKLGEFYNNSSGDIERIISYRPDNGTDYQDVVKGWLSVSLTTGSPVIGDSYNVSSITDNGTGDITVTWTTAFANDDYAVTTGIRRLTSGTSNAIAEIASQTTSSVRLKCVQATDVAIDPELICIQAIGDRT